MKKQHLDLGDAVAHTTYIVNCWVFTSRSKFHGCQTDPKFCYRETRLVGRAQQRKPEHMSHLRTKCCMPTYSYTEWKLIWMGGFYNANRCQPYLCYLLFDQKKYIWEVARKERYHIVYGARCAMKKSFVSVQTTETTSALSNFLVRLSLPAFFLHMSDWCQPRHTSSETTVCSYMYT